MSNYDPTQAMQDEIDRRMKEREKEQKRKDLERQKEKRTEDFNKGLEKLAERVLQYEGKKDTSTYFFLKNFLDLALQLKDLMEDLSAVEDALSCLSDAIGFLDNAISLDEQFVDESLANEYTFFKRLKARRKNRRARRNCKHRMKVITNNLMSKLNMSQELVDSMNKMSVKLKKDTDKRLAKQAKERAKSGAPAPTGPSASDEYLASIRAKKGGSAPSNTGAATTPSGSGDGDNYDDI